MRDIRIADTNGDIQKRALCCAPIYGSIMNESNRDTRILIVDDDPDIRQLVSELLTRNGMQSVEANDVDAAGQKLTSQRIDLILLDIMMPGEDGLSFCRRLRNETQIPVIMLTALGQDIDRVIGLELGADDYLAKPFNSHELIARIKAVLRRAPPLRPGESYQVEAGYEFGNFFLDVNKRGVFKTGGARVALTSGEFALLLALIEHSPRVVSRDQLLDLTRGAVANPLDRSIDSQISRLRKKIEDNRNDERLITTVRNIGYAFSGTVMRARVQPRRDVS